VAAGTLMGEAAVLYPCTRASTVRAESATVLWTLSRDAFTAVVSAHCPVARGISGANDGSGGWAILTTHPICHVVLRMLSCETKIKPGGHSGPSELRATGESV
jgi:CRP-like cAMP-binding protein